MAGMTPRRRVLESLSHREPDRLPIDFGGCPTTTINYAAYTRLREYMGLPAPTTPLPVSRRSQTVTPEDDVLERFQIDTRGVSVRAPEAVAIAEHPDGSYLDEWGVLWSRPEGGHYLPVRGPFQEREPHRSILDSHPWPGTSDPSRLGGVAERARRLHQGTSYAVVISLPRGVFSTCLTLRGFADFLADLLVNRSFAEALMDRVTEVWIAIAEQSLRSVGECVDVVQFADDLGHQHAPLVSPDLYRRLIQPVHARMVGTIKKCSNARVLLHSDGAIRPLIGHLIDAGVEVLNPVQVSAEGMDTLELKRLFGDHLSFWGAIDTQEVLPYGNVERVRAEVRRRIRDLARQGGYVLASVHNIQPDVPPENIVAMFETALESGGHQ